MKLFRPLSRQAKVEKERRALDRGDEVRSEVGRCSADVVYFTNRHCIIDDAQGHGDGSGVMPFDLWPDQAVLMRGLVDGTNTIILKARQLGITWCVCAYVLWLALFRPGKVVLLFSIGEREAAEMLRRVKALYDRLPDHLRAHLPRRTRDMVSEQAFANGSIIRSLPASQRAGRSFTASVLVMDEAAHMQWASKLLTGAKPTIDNGGQLIILSTANGIGGMFHNVWSKGVKAVNAFKTVFLSWRSRPDRDQAWYDRQVAEADDPESIKQEYPSTPTEAFLSSGRNRFPEAWLEKLATGICDPLPLDRYPDHFEPIHNGLRIYRLPIKGRKTLLCADVSEGIEKLSEAKGKESDYCAAVLLDKLTGEELACLHGRWEPDEFARRLWLLADLYDSQVIVERNNHGHAVILALRKLKDSRVARGEDHKRGWLTTKQTRPVGIDSLAAAIRDGDLIIHSQAIIDEMQTFVVNEKGKPEAAEGYHDDLVMALAALFGWKKLGISTEFKVYDFDD